MRESLAVNDKPKKVATTKVTLEIIYPEAISLIENNENEYECLESKTHNTPNKPNVQPDIKMVTIPHFKTNFNRFFISVIIIKFFETKKFLIYDFIFQEKHF